MKDGCVLLDTNFFIRLLNEEDPLHKNIRGFYQHFLEKEFRLKFSTVSIAEFCVRGTVDELPLPTIEILPFNINHASAAGEFTKLVLENRGGLELPNRHIIKDDAKLFAQAHVEKEITTFATSDAKLIKTYNFLKESTALEFDIINTGEPFTSVLGILPFPS